MYLQWPDSTADMVGQIWMYFCVLSALFNRIAHSLHSLARRYWSAQSANLVVLSFDRLVHVLLAHLHTRQLIYYPDKPSCIDKCVGMY